MDVKRPAKVGHTKSRSGCLTCRKRRVKCDEARPSCRRCARLDLKCVFPGSDSSSNNNVTSTAAAATTIPAAPATVTNSDTSSSAATPADSGSPLLLESRARRISELRLLQYWMSQNNILTGPETTLRWRDLWFREVPTETLGNDHTHYALLALAGTHQLVNMAIYDAGLVAARDFYWGIAVSEQRRAIDAGAPADGLVIAALLISMNAFSDVAVRHGLHETVYSPPSTWLSIGAGAWTLLRRLRLDLISPATTLGRLLALSRPVSAQVREPLAGGRVEAWLPAPLDLERIPEQDVRESYQLVARFVARFKAAMREGEVPGQMLCRVFMLPGVVSQLFIDQVVERQPRALLLIAQFFTAVDASGVLNMFFQTTDRLFLQTEVQGIRTLLPVEWHPWIG